MPANDPSTDLCLRIGKRLRHLRELRGLTQQDLARRAGMTSRRLSLCEQGRLCEDERRQIMAEELYRLSLHLRVPVTIFFDETCIIDESIAFVTASPDCGTEAARLIRAFNGIENTRVRRELFELIAATSRSFGVS